MQPAVLFISYDGITDPLGQSQVLPYLAGLSRHGFRVHLLSCEKREAFAQNREQAEKAIEAHQISWHPLPYTKRPPVLSTLADLYRLRRKAAILHRKFQFSLVHTRPGIPALAGAWMKRKWGIPFLHDIREFYADSRVEGGIWKRSHPLYALIYRYFKRKEAEQLRCCDGIVCLTKAAASIIRKEKDFRSAVPMEIIPCSADLQLFNPDAVSPEQQAALRDELGIRTGDVIVSYLGSVGGWYLTDEMLRFCKLLTERLPAARFLFISPHLHEQIRALASKHGLRDEQIIIRKGSRHEIPALLSLSSYSVFFIKPCFSKQSSSPTKHGEIMAMGIPIITNSGVGDVQSIVEEYKSGYIATDFSDHSFKEVISRMLQEPAPDPALIRRGAEEVYSLDKAIEAYVRLYRKITCKSK